MALNDAFRRTLKQFEKAKIAQVEDVVKNTAERILDMVADLSPVGQPDKWSNLISSDRVIAFGYEPGRYLSNWTVGLDGVNTAEQPPEGGSKTGVTSRGMAVINQFKIGVNSLTIANIAHNPQTQEYYPALLETKGLTSWPGYKYEINAFSYSWQERNQDGVIGPVKANLEGIFSAAVKTAT